MTVIEDFRTALETSDPTTVVEAFAEDVVLHSPATITTEYTGRERVVRILTFALQTLRDVRFTDELHSVDQPTHGLVFEGTIDGQGAQGVFYLATGPERIQSLTLLLRPRRAVEAFVEAMGALGAEPARDFAAGKE